MTEKRISRRDVPVEDTWRLEDIFADDAAWETEYAALTAQVAGLESYRGKLNEKAMLKAALDEATACERKADALFTYARMRRDEDNNVAKYQALTARAQALMTDMETATAYLAPELLSLDEKYLRDRASDADFADYSMLLADLIRRRPHTLSMAEERLLAMTGDMATSASTAYDMLTDADIKFPEIADGAGGTVEITQANFIPLMMNRSEAVRRAAFEGLYGTFASFSATIPALYAGSVKADVFYARAARFSSAIEHRLFPDNIPMAVYDNLVAQVNRHLPGLQRFVQINARLNGIEQMHFSDLYLPPELGFDISLPYHQAYDLVVKSLGVLGKDYQATLERARQERWIDPFENKGKSSGAYSWGTYDSHPYVLMSYKPDLDHIQTLAHELGHSMHSFYSNSQPYAKSQYSLFVAEVASTVNEVLLLMALMDAYKDDKKAQAYLLYMLLDSFRTTVFRQTMFAEFERESHRMAEAGEALTCETLNAAYEALNRKYYANLVFDPLIAYEWMRIPHFYRAFYVYKYATGFSAAMAIASMIRTEGEPAVARYKKFLSAGGSVYPLDALRLAGVDMADPKAVENALSQFEAFLRQYEAVTR